MGQDQGPSLVIIYVFFTYDWRRNHIIYLYILFITFLYIDFILILIFTCIFLLLIIIHLLCFQYSWLILLLLKKVNYSKYIFRNLEFLIALPRPLKRSLALDCPCCAQSSLRTTKQWFHVQKHRRHVIGMNNKRPMGHITRLSNKSYD